MLTAFSKHALVGLGLLAIVGCCCLCHGLASKTPVWAFAQRLPLENSVPMMPAITTNRGAATNEVELKPDTATEPGKFSPQNAFFFATLSKLAYRSKSEAAGVLMGNATSAGLGFDRFYWFEPEPVLSSRSIVDEVHDTEAFVAASDDVLLVVFRGTKEGADWWTNLKFNPIGVPPEWKLSDERLYIHTGFWEGLKTVWGGKGGMYDTIRTLYNEPGKKRKLYFSGHSLGGALATLAAGHLVFVDDVKVSGMYTMGSPKVFSDKLADIFNGKINNGFSMASKYFRCRNNNDIVPRVPPGYKHVGTEVYMDMYGTVTQTSLWNRLAGRLSAYIRGQILEDINDHATSEYVRLFKQCVVNARVPLLGQAASIVQDVVLQVTDPQKAAELRKEIEATKNTARTEALEDPKCTAPLSRRMLV